MRLNRTRTWIHGPVSPTGGRQLTIALVFVAAASISAVSHADETRAVQGLEFDSVVVWGSAEVEISQGDENTLRLRGPARALQREPFYLRDEVLHLGRYENGRTPRGVQYKLGVKELESIQLEGSGEIYVKPLRADDLEVGLKGSGDIMLHSLEAGDVALMVSGSGGVQLAQAEVGDLDLKISGSGTIDLGTLDADSVSAYISGSGDIAAAESGAARHISINLMGSGDVDLSDVRAESGDVSIIGSGDSEIWVEEELAVNIIGSGDVSYRGDADVDRNVIGSGEVERRD